MGDIPTLFENLAVDINYYVTIIQSYEQMISGQNNEI